MKKKIEYGILKMPQGQETGILMEEGRRKR